MPEVPSPHSSAEIIRHYLNGHKRIVDGPDGSFTSETPPSVKPALVALDDLVEQLESREAVVRAARAVSEAWEGIGWDARTKEPLAMLRYQLSRLESNPASGSDNG